LEKSKIIENFFYYIVTFSYLILPVCFFCLGNKKREVIPIVIAIYGIVCFCFLYFFYDIPNKERKYLSTSYTFFEYGIFTFIFWVNFQKDKIRPLILVSSTLFFAFQLFYVFSVKIKKLDTIPIGIETILILIYIVYFFYSFSKRLKNLYIYTHYVFWIAVGIMIYLGGSFFFFILIENLSNEQVASFGNNILFALGLFIYARYPFENSKKSSNSIPYLDMI